MFYYNELYLDKKKDEIIILQNSCTIIMGLRKIMVSLPKEVFFQFVQRLQSTYLDRQEFQTAKDSVAVDFPIQGLTMLFKQDDFFRFRKSVNQAVEKLNQFSMGEAHVIAEAKPIGIGGKNYHTPKHKKLVDKAVTRIEKNGFTKDYTIISLAKEIGSNETTLKYAFKSIMKTTPYKFFQCRRMNAAAELLNKGESVGEVSIKVGYSSITHFSHAFKIFYGRSPREYLRDESRGEN